VIDEWNPKKRGNKREMTHLLCEQASFLLSIDLEAMSSGRMLGVRDNFCTRVLAQQAVAALVVCLGPLQDLIHDRVGAHCMMYNMRLVFRERVGVPV
jgi:hypothetical protein